MLIFLLLMDGTLCKPVVYQEVCDVGLSHRLYFCQFFLCEVFSSC